MSSASVPGLETFFREIYHYYCKQGFFCILVQWVAELLTLGFTITFSGFLLFFCKLEGSFELSNSMWHSKSWLLWSSSPSIYGLHSYDPYILNHIQWILDILLLAIFCEVKRYNEDTKVFPFQVSIGYVMIMIFTLVHLLSRQMLHFCPYVWGTWSVLISWGCRLEIKVPELQSTSWPSVVHRLVQIQTHYELGTTRILSAHDIVSWIMHRDNYLTGMLNKNVISMPLPHWLPGACPFVGHDGHLKRKILTKTLEWSLNWCMLHQMFDR